MFGRESLSRSGELLGTGYALLTTPRAAEAAPEIAAAAGSIHHVAAGRVDQLADGLRAAVIGELIVALGGGRVIDVAKALAAADPPRRVAALPTTLSGAEMTAVHRHAAGVSERTPRVRPAIVINDPALSASQPAAELAASAGNALGHAVEGPLTPLTNPVATLAALEAACLIADGLHLTHGDSSRTEPDRDGLALGALLAGYVIGSTGYGLHHVLSQTLVRFAGIAHGAANSIMLPRSLEALERRAPQSIARLSEVLGTPAVEVALRLCQLTGSVRLSDVGVAEQTLELCAEQASQRAELQMTPPAADFAELRELYRAAL